MEYFAARVLYEEIKFAKKGDLEDTNKYFKKKLMKGKGKTN